MGVCFWYNTHMEDSTIFLVMWDMYGIESVVDLTVMEKEMIWNTLLESETKSYSNEINQRVTRMMLRARLNPERNYEIYTIHVTPDVTKDKLTQMFLDSPQNAANLIRERGEKIYSNRTAKKQQIV